MESLLSAAAVFFFQGSARIVAPGVEMQIRIRPDRVSTSDSNPVLKRPGAESKGPAAAVCSGGGNANPHPARPSFNIGFESGVETTRGGVHPSGWCGVWVAGCGVWDGM